MLKGHLRHQLVASKTGVASFENRGGTGQRPVRRGIAEGHKVEAMDSSGMAPGSQTVANGVNTSNQRTNSFLEGLINYEDQKLMRNLYRDIYRYDMIAGTAVDFQSKLPYSEFTITGCTDKKVAQTFLDSVESLNLKSLLPYIAVDQFVLGSFVGTLNFDDNSRIFNAMLSHDLDNCEITPLPVYGMDPLVNVTIPMEWRKVLNSNDPRIQDVQHLIPKELFAGSAGRGASSKVGLNPATTLYLARRGMTTDTIGQSYFNRILLVHFIEKALVRGTIDAAARRRRAITLITAGNDEFWDPTQEDLQNLAQLFMNADASPDNATIATRNDVQVQEVKAPTDFWKFDDIYDLATTAKFRALGISEAFMSGDATISTMETALSTFVENMTAQRQDMTRRVFYEKLFPMISSANDFRRSDDEDTPGVDGVPFVSESRFGSRDGRRNPGRHVYQTRSGLWSAFADGNSSANRQMYALDSTKKLVIPTVQWLKRLKPEADQQYMDMLQALSDRGIPIPLRMMAVAGGSDLEEILAAMPEDIEIRNYIAEQKSQIAGGGDDDQGQQYASFGNLRQTPGAVNRTFTGEEMEVGQFTATGKRQLISAKGKRALDEKTNKTMAIAAARVRERQVYAQKEADYRRKEGY